MKDIALSFQEEEGKRGIIAEVIEEQGIEGQTTDEHSGGGRALHVQRGSGSA